MWKLAVLIALAAVAGLAAALPGAETADWPVESPPPERSSRPFPRLMMTHFRIIDAADRDRLARWDWVVVGGSDPGTVALTPSLRNINPNIKITPYVDASEDNGYNADPHSVSPTSYSSGFSDQWWLKNADGSYANYPPSRGRKMINISPFAAVVNGKKWNDHLAQWIAANYHQDGVFVDVISDPSLNVWPFWKLSARVPNVDLDRNSVADRTEHGTAWIDAQWGAGARDLMRKIRAAIGPAAIVVGNNGVGFNAVANGLSMEAGWVDSNQLNLFQSWISDHFETHYATSQTQAGPQSPNAQTDYKFMRHNLAAALMVDAYFSYADGNGPYGGYHALWWYDEYSVDLATGRATGDSSRKGYLGQPTGAAQELPNGVWRRDFDSGIALVNMANSAQTVDLGGTFRRIRGTQDPVTNSGATVTSVTLSGRDAIILLR
jgi:hypothetical protein